MPNFPESKEALRKCGKLPQAILNARKSADTFGKRYLMQEVAGKFGKRYLMQEVADKFGKRYLMQEVADKFGKR